MSRSRKSGLGGLLWTATSGVVQAVDPEITPNQFWCIGLLTDDEFSYAPFSTAKATLERVRVEGLLWNVPEEVADPPEPFDPEVGFILTQVFMVAVVKMPENNTAAAGDWVTTAHDGVTIDPMDAAFYTGGVDVLYRKLVTRQQQLTQIVAGDPVRYLWAPYGETHFELDVQSRRRLTEADSVYLVVYPIVSNQFSRSFQLVLNARTLYRTNN